MVDRADTNGRETLDGLIRRLAAQPLDDVRRDLAKQTNSLISELGSIDDGIKDVGEDVGRYHGALTEKLNAAAARDEELLALARLIADQFEPRDTARHRREEPPLRMEERLRALSAHQQDLAESVAGVARSLSRLTWILAVTSMLLVAVLAMVAVLVVSAA